jgi:hypothetical protein
MPGGASEKFATTGFDYDMQDRLLKSWIDCMSMRLPISSGKIELDVSTPYLAAIYADDGIGEIRSSLAVPSSELHDVDLFARVAHEAATEIAGKPPRLQFQFGKMPRNGKEWTFANLRCGTQL